MTTPYDLIVLGTGNAGMAAAGHNAEAGRRVAVIESDLVGGTCPNRGCVPKKILVAATESLDAIARAGAHGISVEAPTLDWSKLMSRKREMIGGMPQSMASSLERRGIDLIRGNARFTSPTEVVVGDKALQASKFVIATGARPRPLALPGAELMITSNDILDLDELPKRIAFVGAGVIGLELGHVLARAGVQVTLLEAAPRPLGNFDEAAVDALVVATRELGIDLRVDVRVESIEALEGHFVVRGQRAGEPFEVHSDQVANGTGRVANVDLLGLDAAGVSVNGHRVELDDHLRAAQNPNILFAGDAVPNAPQLATLATVEGRIAGFNAFADDDVLKSPDYAVVPQAVFAVPALAGVGLRGDQVSGDDVDVVDTNMSGWLSARSYAESTAFARLVIDRKADRVLGAHLVGHGASEVIHTFALAMRYGIPASDFKTFVYAYPTFTNDIKFLL